MLEALTSDTWKHLYRVNSDQGINLTVFTLPGEKEIDEGDRGRNIDERDTGRKK